MVTQTQIDLCNHDDPHKYLRDHVGTMIADKSGNPYLIQEQDEDLHIDGCMIDIFTGKICHYSRVGPFTTTNPQSIMW